MIVKPEFSIGLEKYGERTRQEYQWLLERMGNEINLEVLHNLMRYVYKDGVKDGITLYRELDTN